MDFSSELTAYGAAVLLLLFLALGALAPRMLHPKLYVIREQGQNSLRAGRPRRACGEREERGFRGGRLQRRRQVRAGHGSRLGDDWTLGCSRRGVALGLQV